METSTPTPTPTPTPTDVVEQTPVPLYADQVHQALTIGHQLLLVVLVVGVLASIYFGIQIVRSMRS